jgi:hypothetical protein
LSVRFRVFSATIAALALGGCSPDFNSSSIDEAKAEITRNLVQKGMFDADVQLVKSGKRKLTGFAKGNQTVPGVGKVPVTLTCEATMSDSSTQYVWTCKP